MTTHTTQDYISDKFSYHNSYKLAQGPQAALALVQALKNKNKFKHDDEYYG